MCATFTDEQVEFMLEKLREEFPKLTKNPNTRNYIWLVLLPVCCITIVMEQKSLTYDEAEKLLAHISSR